MVQVTVSDIMHDIAIQVKEVGWQHWTCSYNLYVEIRALYRDIVVALYYYTDSHSNGWLRDYSAAASLVS